MAHRPPPFFASRRGTEIRSRTRRAVSPPLPRAGIGTVTATEGSSTISLSGETFLVPTCGITVNVTGTTAGAKTNTSGNVSSTNGGTGNTATASLTVVAPPHIIKTFKFGAPIPLNGTMGMGLAIDNPNLTVSLTGLTFTDTLPAGLVVATPNGLSQHLRWYSHGGIW
jgi:hypothetical protein